MAFLDAIEALRGKPVTELNEKEWDATLGLGGIHRYKDQLSMHLEQCTKGNARRIVATCGERNALDAWRQLADRGCSMRLQNVHILLKRAMYPKKDVNNKDLEASIADWERDLEIHARATGEYTMTKSTQRMLLLEMCPPALRTHLRMREHLIPDLPAMRQEISDWLFEELPRKKADKTLGDNEEQGTKEEEWEETHVWSDEHGGWICGLAPKRPRTEATDQDEEMPPASPA